MTSGANAVTIIIEGKDDADHHHDDANNKF
jgi:hypothetical protein